MPTSLSLSGIESMMSSARAVWMYRRRSSCGMHENNRDALRHAQRSVSKTLRDGFGGRANQIQLQVSRMLNTGLYQY